MGPEYPTTFWKRKGKSWKPVSPLRFAAETFLEDALEEQPDLLGVDVLIIGRQVELPCGRKVDLLAIDRDGALLAIEVKREAAAPKAFGQVVGYAYQIATMTHDEIARQCLEYAGVPLPVAFRERFGTELPETINVRQLPVLVAPAFNSGAVDVMNLHLGRGVPLLVVRVTGCDIAGSIILASSFERAEVSPEARTALSRMSDADDRMGDADGELRATTVWALPKFQQTVLRFLNSLEGLPRPTVVPLPPLESIAGVHFDIICFLGQYVPLLRREFVPYSLLKLIYDHWTREQAAHGVLRYPSSDIHFPRQLKKGMEMIGGWEWDALLAEKAHPLMSGDEPLADLVGWRMPLASPRITGYRRVDVGSATR